MARLKLSRLAIIAMAIVIVVALALGGFLFATGGLGVNSNTEELTFNGVTGGGASGGLGTQTTPEGELLDQSLYIASWSPQLIGQRATAVAALRFNGDMGGCSYCLRVSVPEIEIRIILWSPGGELLNVERKFIQLNPANVQADQWYEVGNHYWDIISPDGKTVISDGSLIEAQLLARVVWHRAPPPFFFPVEEDKGWSVHAVDRAVVASGIGTVHWRGGHSDGANGIYVITGERIDACWDVGYSSEQRAGSGWSIQIFSAAQNAVVFGPQRVALTDSQLQGCVTYQTADNDFAYNTTTNQLVVTLKNELWNKDFQVLATVRSSDVPRMPICYDDGFEPQSPRQGDTITYKFHCEAADDAPMNQVASIKVQWGYGSLDNEATLPGDATQYQFTATQPGIINLALTGYTVDGVPSGSHNYRVSVEHQPDNTCIGSPAYCNQNEETAAGLPVWLWFVFAGIGALVAGVLIPRGLIPILIRVILFLLSVVFFLLAFIFYG